MAARFDFKAPAVFAWMGVTMYLTKAAIESTLSTIASAAGSSRLVMTYNLPADSLDGLSRRVTLALQDITTSGGEPWFSWFTPVEIENLVAGHGFTRIQHVGPAEARRAYFGGRQDVWIAGAQRVLVATVP